MRTSAVLLLLAAAAGGGSAAPAKPTLDDCKDALKSLTEKPWSTALPFMAASTGAYVCFASYLLACGCVCMCVGLWSWEGGRLALAPARARGLDIFRG